MLGLKVQNFDNVFVIEDLNLTLFNLQLIRLIQKTGKPFCNTEMGKRGVQHVTFYHPVI